VVDPERLSRLLARVTADVLAIRATAGSGDLLADPVRLRAVTDAVARAVGFRNVLVHQYAEVDDDRVVANLELSVDLDRFVHQLARWARAR